MPGEKITTLLNEAFGIGVNDLMLISKEIAPLVFESQKINPNNLFYDSGTKNIPDENGVFGLPHIGTNPDGPGSGWILHPKLRIVNRTVFLSGVLTLPLSSTANGQTLANDFFDYDESPLYAAPWLYKGVNGGYNLLTNGIAQSRLPILPATLWPDSAKSLNTSFQGIRNIKITNSKRFPLQTYLNRLDIAADGTLVVVPTVALEGNGNKNFSITSPLSELNSIYNSGDFLPDYSSYRSGFTGPTNLRNLITAGETSPITIDAREVEDLGAFYLPFNSSYQLDINTPMDLIIAAFDAL